IELPEDGVFVSLGWLPKESNNSDSEKPPIILGNMNADRNYVFRNFKDIKWFPANSKSYTTDGFRVPNISITVTY
ncbi:MAG TPA: hypothetical protein VF623_03355, partial [Segetibacter sp.]